ncbi:DUF4193 domain-containing protein [Arthrobacter mobilis]|uniref:DUF4193 domain-containing protein n=1 Tax=Arthrobacter mobilis TaxID=2724944 RepID=A0A7X6HG21_9MICC|nr:DUF4193 domain-containing protein [Arthrobacter mobilis]NKX55503.1 DUF4193 domain-containing protein [Arthrobacter mobilis]
MATDYDAPRSRDEDEAAEPLDVLGASHPGRSQDELVDAEDADVAEAIELPGADLSGEELVIQIVPPRQDEFTCSSCFLIRHRSQVAREKDGLLYCLECEG